MTARITSLPPVNIGYAQARTILRHHRLHDLDAIDCAFEVLVFSEDPADRALCSVVADEMWQVPAQEPMTIAVGMLAVALSFFGLASIFAQVLL